MIEETIIKKIIDIFSVVMSLGVFIALYLIYKTHNDRAKKYIYMILFVAVALGVGRIIGVLLGGLS